MVMTGLGAFAEQVAVDERSVVVLPDGFDAQRAAAFIQSYCTVEFALTRRTQVQAGESVLVLGAGGGIGLAAIDVAKSLGARVIAAASSTDKLEAARAAGADETVSYAEEDLKGRARELSGGGVDVVIDPVGGPHADAALRATGVGGRYVVIGFASGTIPTIKANLVLLNNRTVVGVDWGAWSSRHREENTAMLGDLVQRVADGRLHPPAPTAFPLAAAGQVLTDALDRRLTGKAVLVP
jgi:NADPH2:quinone reductase